MHRLAALAVVVFASSLAAADPAPAAKHLAPELEHIALPDVAQHAGASAKTATELGRASLAAVTARFKADVASDDVDVLRYRVLEADRWLAHGSR